MNRSYIYHIFILKEFLTKIFGVHYPAEIIGLIVIAGYKDIIIGCGQFHTILFDDKMHVWGNEQYHQKNISFENIADIKSISCGYDYTIALTFTPNKLYVWGKNDYGQLGLGDNHNQAIPQELKLKLILCSAIKSVSCGVRYTIALLNTGECYSWGSNLCGQLGLGDTISQYSPTKLILQNIMSVNCGGVHSTALTKKGTLWVWGHNVCGQLGLGDNRDRYIANKLTLPDIISVSCGGLHTMALTSSNGIYVWGANTEGQLGLGDYNNRNTPQKLNLLDVVSINCGTFHTIALTKVGILYSWGNNERGQLGLGHDDNVNTPREFIFHEHKYIKSIHCGGCHTFIITTTNKIYCWGVNESGQLGLHDTDDRCVPTEVIF